MAMDVVYFIIMTTTIMMVDGVDRLIHLLCLLFAVFIMMSIYVSKV